MDKMVDEKEVQINENCLKPLCDDELACANGGMLLCYSRWVCLDCGAHGEWSSGTGFTDSDTADHRLKTGHQNYKTETIHPANYET